MRTMGRWRSRCFRLALACRFTAHVIPSPVSIHPGRRTWRWAHTGTLVRAQHGERKLEPVVVSDARVRAAVGGALPCPWPDQRLEFHLERRTPPPCARGLGDGRTGRTSPAHYCNAQIQVGLCIARPEPVSDRTPRRCWPWAPSLVAHRSMGRGEHATGKVRVVRTKLRSNGTILRRVQQASPTRVACVAGSAAGTGSRGCRRSDGTCVRNATGR